MKLIDRIHKGKRFLGSRRIVDELADQARKEDQKRARRFMRLMDIQAIHPVRRHRSYIRSIMNPSDSQRRFDERKNSS